MAPSWTGRNLQDFENPPCLIFSPFPLSWIQWEEETRTKLNPRVCHSASCGEFVNSPPPLSTLQKWDQVKERAVLERTPPSSNENLDRGVIQGSAAWGNAHLTSQLCIQRNFWEGYCSVLACKLNLEVTHYQAFFQVFSCINKSNLLFERCLLTWIFLVLSIVTCSGTIL